MLELSNKVVLVTGASMGIGEAFARDLAARGARLVLVARGEERLRQLARSLPASSAPEVVAMDLGAPGAAARLRGVLAERGIAIDILVNNAGFATYGEFAAVSLQEQGDEIQLNVRAVVELAHVFLPDIEARKGGIINVASTAAFQPLPYMAVYGATKAFVLSFSEALWGEYRQRGVRVLALCPGATDTPFFARVGAEEAAVGKKADPADLVRVALEAFARNRSHVIHGTGNYFLAQTARLVPRATAVAITANMLKPRTPRALRSRA